MVIYIQDKFIREAGASKPRGHQALFWLVALMMSVALPAYAGYSSYLRYSPAAADHAFGVGIFDMNYNH